MRKIKTILGILAVLIILAVISALILRYNITHQALPDYNESLEIDGIDQEISVFRDKNAIPHIYAESEKDLYTAVGYLMAQDRLWQMDLLRRATTGNLAEIFGKNYATTDELMRSLQITEKSQTVYSQSSKEVQTALQAFANGVNQYIENNKKDLPPEFSILQYKPDPWEPIHSVNLIGYMAWDLTMPWSYEMTLHALQKKLPEKKYESLIPDISSQPTAIYPDFSSKTILENLLNNLLTQKHKLEDLGLKVFSGSNNWAVSGEKSTTGKPILANDMHLGLFAPGIWQQMHMVVKGKVNVTGVVLPGQPFVISGHNDSIAWGLTNVMLDDMDFYYETLNEDSTQYLVNGQWKDLTIEHASIPVKGGDTVTRKIRYTHRGPIISSHKEIQNKPVSMRWIGNEFSNELRTMYLFNHAANWQEFKNAARSFKSISQNIVYADVQGNIGLYCCAGIPIREGNGISVYPGDTTRYDWKGLVPFEHLPHSYNPESGFVASANNKTVNEDYPYYISHWFDLPSRINRIRELLTSKDQLSVQDFKAIQTDQQSDMVQRLKPQIVESLKKNATEMNEAEQKAFTILKEWNGNYSKESSAALIFERFYIELAHELAGDEFGDSLISKFMGRDILVRNLIDRAFREKNNNWTDNIETKEKEESLEELITSSFQQTIKALIKTAGDKPAEWSWSDYHTLTLKHPLGQKKILDKIFDLNRGPFHVGGSYHTVCPYSYSYNNPYVVDHGASHRQIYSLADWDDSWSVIPTGNSGIPASKHYCDQTSAYINKKYHPDLFNKETVKENKQYEMKFIPKLQ